MKRAILISAVGMLLVFAAAIRADTLHLKDGSTVSGTIVGFDQNSFRVKTSYGFAVVRRDAVASIDVGDANATAEKKPSSPAPAAAPPAPKPVASKPAQPDASPNIAAANDSPKPAAPAAQPSKPAVNSAARPAAPQPSSSSVAATKPSTAAPTSSTATTSAMTPHPPAASGTPSASASATKAASPTAKNEAHPSVAAAKPPPPPPPKLVEEPIREESSGNSYTNLTYGFDMFKPPTWEIIPEARKTLPGAIAALGTRDETTYLLIGTSPATGSLDSDLKASDNKLHEMFDNYRALGDTHTTIAGENAIERKFRGSVETREWSGVVVLLERKKQTYTILGMTYANSDLVQIQENVIRRVISSMQFNP